LKIFIFKEIDNSSNIEIVTIFESNRRMKTLFTFSPLIRLIGVGSKPTEKIATVKIKNDVFKN